MHNARALLYGLLRAQQLYLPSLTDKSLTEARMRDILEGKLTTLPVDCLEEFEYSPSVSKKRLRDAIIQIYAGPVPVWFESGVLPNRQYLAEFLYSLDANHALLGARINEKRKRIFKSHQNCKSCLTRHNKKEKREEEKIIPKGTRPSKRPVDMPTSLNIPQQVIYCLTSRHKITGLRKGCTRAYLESEGCENLDVLADIQTEVHIIDNIIDTINNLQK